MSSMHQFLSRQRKRARSDEVENTAAAGAAAPAVASSEDASSDDDLIDPKRRKVVRRKVAAVATTEPTPGIDPDTAWYDAWERAWSADDRTAAVTYAVTSVIISVVTSAVTSADTSAFTSAVTSAVTSVVTSVVTYAITSAVTSAVTLQPKLLPTQPARPAKRSAFDTIMSSQAMPPKRAKPGRGPVRDRLVEGTHHCVNYAQWSKAELASLPGGARTLKDFLKIQASVRAFEGGLAELVVRLPLRDDSAVRRRRFRRRREPPPPTHLLFRPSRLVQEMGR